MMLGVGVQVFRPISDNVALSQKIVGQITDAIIKRELRPGDRLPTERELAELFKVSRTAIRDAVKLLAGRGLVTVRHGVGIFVAAPAGPDEDLVVGFSSGNLRDVFEIRKALETQAAHFAALRFHPDHIEKLERILQDARAHQDDLSVLNECDAQFHLVIAEASQNLLLVKVMWTLLDALEESRSKSLQISGRPIVSLSEHEEILTAIKSKNAEAARQKMLSHLESVETKVLGGRNQHPNQHSHA